MANTKLKLWVLLQDFHFFQVETYLQNTKCNLREYYIYITYADNSCPALVSLLDFPQYSVKHTVL